MNPLALIVAWFVVWSAAMLLGMPWRDESPVPAALQTQNAPPR